jgi:hypothetical protein
MVNKSVLVGKLSPYLGQKKLIVYNQNTSDIINELVKNHKVNANEYVKIYKSFLDYNVLNIAKNLFNFCKKNIKYRIETGNGQSLRSPAAILINGYGDCKQYSQFIGGVLDAINRNGKKIDWCYRFAAYNLNKDIQHVFIVLKINNIEYWIDPVLDYFNEKKMYNYKIDKKMSLYQISGFNNDEIGRLKLKLPKIKIAKALKQVSIKNVKNLVLKVGLSPARNAFLALVSVNSFNLAKKIAKGILKDRRKIELFWKDLGGDFKALLRAVNNRQSQFRVNGMNVIGLDPATGTAAAAASPIIAKILSILKDMGIDTKDIAGSVSKLAEKEAIRFVENKGKAIVENGFKSVLKKNNQGVEQVEITQATPEEMAQSTNINNSIMPASSTPGEKKKDNTILYAAAGAAALYFITKK